MLARDVRWAHLHRLVVPLAKHEVAPAASDQVDALRERAPCARDLDHHFRAPTLRPVEDPGAALGGIGQLADVERVSGAPASRDCEALGGAADHDHGRRARPDRERRREEPERSGALNRHAVRVPDPAEAIEPMDHGAQRARGG